MLFVSEFSDEFDSKTGVSHRGFNTIYSYVRIANISKLGQGHGPAKTLYQAMSESKRPNFKVSGIPSRLAPAVEVTDGEYRTARLHRAAIFTITGLGLLLGWVVDNANWIVVTIPILNELTIPTIFGIVFYLIARYRFPKASQLKAPRLRLYPEYKRFKLASDAFAKDAKANLERSSE